MLELNLLSLGEAELAGDIGNRLLRKHDRAGTHRADAAGKLNVFDRLGEALQAAAILFKKAQARPIDLTVNQQTDQTLVTQHRRERQLALRAVESRDGVAERLAMNARHVFVGGVAHRGVISIDVERAHGAKIISRPRLDDAQGQPQSPLDALIERRSVVSCEAIPFGTLPNTASA